MHGSVTHSGQILSSAASPSTVFDYFKQHCSADRTNTGLYVLETLRQAHPDYHITTVTANSGCGGPDFRGFAKAGLARCALQLEGDNLVRVRTYTPPQGRLDPGDGVLGETISFAEYRYTLHEERDVTEEPYTLYYIEWTEPMMGMQAFWYILTPSSLPLDPVTTYCSRADRLLTAVGKWTARLHNEIYVFDTGRWHKSAPLYAAVQAASWTDVILSERMKSTLVRDVGDFFQRRETYARFGVPWQRGIILHGPPGCGKTISIKALLKSMHIEHDVAGLYVKSLDSQQGLQASVRQIFQRARLMAPCLLVFEDLDSLVTNDVRSYFLNEVDGLEANTGILMIGSTNHLSRLDPAIAKRPSRFDRKYLFALPAEQERKTYCAYWRGKILEGGEVEFPEEICDVVARMTEGFSFAYLKELFVQTLLTVVGGRGGDDEEEDEESAASAAQDIVTADQAITTEGSASLLQSGESVSSATPAPETISSEAAPAQGPADPVPASTAAILPEVVIPSHLQDNALLRILVKQHRALRREMDNTTDEIHARPKVAPSGNSVQRVFQGKRVLVRHGHVQAAR